MKRIQILAYQAGLVYRKGRLIRVLKEGAHWIRWSNSVVICNMNKVFTSQSDLHILLENTTFRSMVNVLTVHDNEIAILEKNGLVESVLTRGKYVIWKESIEHYSWIVYDTEALEVPGEAARKLDLLGNAQAYTMTFVVEDHAKGLLYTDGKLEKMLEPGTYHYWKNMKKVLVVMADMRTQYLEISGQEILTKDKAAIRVNAQAQYVIQDVVLAMSKTKDYARQLYSILQLGIRAYIGTMTLDEILSRKEEIESKVLAEMSVRAEMLGVKILSCGIRDIILPGDVKDIMNTVLIAEKRAQANVIMRREETASARSLLNTAKLMEDNAMLYKLKEMEYVERIAEKINSITVSGGGKIVDQLTQIFSGDKA